MPGKVNALNLHNNVFNYGRFVRVLDQIYGISPYIEQQLTPAVGIEMRSHYRCHPIKTMR